MTKKQVHISTNPNGWWRQHEKHYDPLFPSKEEAKESFNTLVWYCIWQWLKPWNYSTIWLLLRMRKYINLLK